MYWRATVAVKQSENYAVFLRIVKAELKEQPAKTHDNRIATDEFIAAHVDQPSAETSLLIQTLLQQLRADVS